MLKRRKYDFKTTAILVLCIAEFIITVLLIVYAFWSRPFDNPKGFLFPATGLNLAMLLFYFATAFEILLYSVGLKILPIVFGLGKIFVCSFLMMAFSWYTFSIAYANSVANVGSFYDCTTAFVITYIFTFVALLSFFFEILLPIIRHKEVRNSFVNS